MGCGERKKVMMDVHRGEYDEHANGSNDLELMKYVLVR